MAVPSNKLGGALVLAEGIFGAALDMLFLVDVKLRLLCVLQEMLGMLLLLRIC